jgi:hypothetical protein
MNPLCSLMHSFSPHLNEQPPETPNPVNTTEAFIFKIKKAVYKILAG